MLGYQGYKHDRFQRRCPHGQDDDRTYAIRSQKEFSQLQVAFYYKVSDASEIGTEVDVNMQRGDIALTAAGSYNWDSNNKVRYVMDSNSQLQLAYEYKLNDQVQAFVGTKYSL